MGEHQKHNSVIFSIQHCSENTALCTENMVLLVTCIIFGSLKVAKPKDLLTRNALNQLKHLPLSYNMKNSTCSGALLYLLNPLWTHHKNFINNTEAMTQVLCILKI